MQYEKSDSSGLLLLRQFLLNKVVNGYIANFLGSGSHHKLHFEAQTLEIIYKSELFAPQNEYWSAATETLTAGALVELIFNSDEEKTELIYVLCFGSCAVLHDKYH